MQRVHGSCWQHWEQDTDNSDDCDTVKSAPTQNEALQAALLLRKYTKDLNDPFACRSEMMLGSFGQQTRVQEMQGMRDTKLMKSEA